MEDSTYTTQTSSIATSHAAAPKEQRQTRRWVVIGAVVGLLIILGVIIGGVIWLLQPATDSARIADLFIIFGALMWLLLGLALVILLVELAILTNLLINELKPILQSLNEITSNVRGTSTFLSDNLTEPVIKMSQFSSGFSQVIRFVGLFRRNARRR